MGFDPKKHKRHHESVLLSPWNTNENQNVIIADFLPNPSDNDFQNRLQDLLAELLPQLDESTLCLFTSIASLKSTWKFAKTNFKEQNKALFAQHIDGTIENLTGLFKERPGACLFGTQVFWDGVDLPGKQLENLVITKLPFPNPNQPLLEAITKKKEALGKNAFKEHLVPETVMNLKQGMGRLLRTSDDRGNILLLDKRILTQPYGKQFQKIWNNQHVVVKNFGELLEAMRERHS